MKQDELIKMLEIALNNEEDDELRKRIEDVLRRTRG